MFPIFNSPMRLFFRSHLLLTTALISLAPLPFGAGMARAQMYLDNASPGGGGYQTESGNWSTDSVIWNDGAGNAVALPADEIGVLTGGDVTLTVGGPGVGNSSVYAGGLQVDSGNFTLTDGHLRSGDQGTGTGTSISFLVVSGSTLTIQSDVTATAAINVLASNALRSEGPRLIFGSASNTSGTINNDGSVLHAGEHTGDVVNDNFFAFSGTIDGDLTNTFEPDSTAPGNTVNIAGTLTGTLTNHDLVTTTNTGGSLGGLINMAGAAVNVTDEDTLAVSATVANSGVINLNGGTLAADVGNALGGTVSMNAGATETTAAVLDGTLESAGHLQGTGTITGDLTIGTTGTASFSGDVQGALSNAGELLTNGDLDVASLSNTGEITVSSNNTLDIASPVTSSGTITIDAGATLDTSAVANSGTINLAGTLDAGLTNATATTVGQGTVTMTSPDAVIVNNVTNFGTMSVQGEIQGRLNNRNIVTTTGDITVGQLVTGGSFGSTTIAQGHTLTSTEQAQNYTTTTIAGTLTGDIFNGIDPNAPTTPAPTPGTLVLSGGTIDGEVTNAGQMNANGTVEGRITNSGTLTTTGDLSVNLLNNSGTTQVQAGHELTSSGAINNSGQMSVIGDVELSGSGRLTNNSGGTLTMGGGNVSGSVTNNGTMNVNSETEIIGSLTNNASGTLALNSTGGADVTLSVSSTFTNYGTVNGTGTGALTIATGTYVNAGGTVTNVNVVGNLRNEAELNYSEDSFLNGSLTNTATGDITVSAALDMNGQNVTNRGDFLITTDPDSVGHLQEVRTLVNEAGFTIATGGTASANLVSNRQGGTMAVAGTLNSATQVNNTGATMTVSGVINAARGVVNRSTPTETGLISMAGGTINGTLTNHAELVGAGIVTGLVTNDGTIAPVGTLQVAGLTNHEDVNIGASAVLQSAATVENRGRLDVAGALQAGLNNHATTTLSGGTITGAVSNTGTGTISGNGTIDGTLANAGSLLVADGVLQVAELTNSSRLSVEAGGTLQSTAEVQNSGSAVIAGNLEADLANSGTTELSGGTITGAVSNTGTGSMSGNGTIAGTLANAGTATIGGRVTGLVTNEGTLILNDTLMVAGLNNTETLNVTSGNTLQSASEVSNDGSATIAGALLGGMVNSGTTVLDGGSVDSLRNGDPLRDNIGTLSGTGTIGTLTNNATASIGGRVDTLNNNGTLNSSGTLSVGTLTNDGTLDNSGTLSVSALTNNDTLDNSGILSVGTLTNNDALNVAANSTLRMDSDNALQNLGELVVEGTIEGRVNNQSSTAMDGGSVNGSLSNNAGAMLSGHGTISGTLQNAGIVTVTGKLTVGQFQNDGTTTIETAGTLESQNVVNNTNALTVWGQLAAGLVNRAGATTELEGGTITGNVENRGTLTGTGTLDARLENRGDAEIGGTVSDLANLAGGTLTTSGTLSAGRFQNDATATVAAETRLSVDETAQNSEGALLTVSGQLDAALSNNGTLDGDGTITGPVTNNGTATWRGHIATNFINHGDATLTGSVGGTLRNEDGATLATAGELSVTDQGFAINAGGGAMTIAADSVLRATNGLTNEAGGNLTLTGEMDGNIVNAGTMGQTGTLTGSLLTTGTADIDGSITGDLIYQGGALTTGDNFDVGRDLRLEADYAVATGRAVKAARTVVTSGNTLALQGALQGALLNQGTVNVHGTDARVSGIATNNGLISLSDDSESMDRLTVGGLSGSGTYALDVDTRNAVSDRIVINGGPATGAYALQLNFLYPNYILSSDNRLTLIDVDESLGAQNDFTVTHNDLPAISERIVYSVDTASGHGDVTLVAQTNPAIGALFGNVALTQSLIGSVINRPTSPFVTALAYEDKAKPCGVGSWGRVTGGHAKATGSTNNGVSSVEAEVSADYYGMQVGTDLACFDDRFGGWNMAFGILGGINRGDTNQPVYAIDPNNSQNMTGTLTSYTSTDFEQRYVGVYMTATRGRLQADLQYRLEKTDFTIENTPVGGHTGLGLDETDFSSDGYTVSGSLSYGIPVGESGWAVVPTVGFAWSEMSTDSIDFGASNGDVGYRLTFEDSTRKIGFVGATLAKTFVQPTRNAALSTFATATWYKDFADPTISVFSQNSDTSFTPQKLESDNLGAYGEISIGANWIKILGPKSRGRQISAGARIDARFGDQLDSVGVSGQFRWQF